MEPPQDNRFHEAFLMSLALLGRFRSFKRRMTIGNIGAIYTKPALLAIPSLFHTIPSIAGSPVTNRRGMKWKRISYCLTRLSHECNCGRLLNRYTSLRKETRPGLCGGVNTQVPSTWSLMSHRKGFPFKACGMGGLMLRNSEIGKKGRHRMAS